MMTTVHVCEGASLPLSHADALNLLRVVTDAATDFMIAYPGPESERLVHALDTVNRLVSATSEIAVGQRDVGQREAA